MRQKTRRSAGGWLGIVLGLLVLSVVSVGAQSTWPAGAPFRLVADVTDVANTVDYVMRQDGKDIQTLPVSAVANGTITFSHAGLPPGSYQFTVVARNAFGATTSLPLGVNFGGAPLAPTGLRIIAS